MQNIYKCILLLLLPLATYSQSSFVKTIGNPYLDDANAMIRTRDGGCFMVGYTYTNDVNTWDVYAVKLDSNYNVKWTNAIGGAGNDSVYGSGSDYGYAAAQTDDGYIIGGISYSFGNNDMYIIKLKNNGSLQWTKTIGGNVDDYANAVIETSDKGFLFVGSTFSYANKQDVYVVKLDSLGKLLWVKSIGGAKPDEGKSVIEVGDGYVITGYTQSFGFGKNDVYVVKLNKSGNLLWSKAIGGSNDEVGNSIKRTLDNGLIIAGYTSSFGQANKDAYLIKLSSNGDLQWSKTFGTADNDDANSIIKTNDGGYAFVGDLTANSCVVKLDASANVQWAKAFYGINNLSLYSMLSIIQTSDSGFAIAGQGFYNTPNGDFAIIKCDKNGNFCVPTSTVGIEANVSSNIVEPSTVIKFEKDKLIKQTSTITKQGTFNNACVNTLASSSLYKASINHDLLACRVYPNPAKNSLTVSFNAKKKSVYIITVSNAYGKQLLKLKYNSFIGYNQATLDVSHLANGLYYLSVDNNEQKEILKFIKQD